MAPTSAPRRGRAGDPVRPIIIPGGISKAISGSSVYFDELNAVFQEIDHSFLCAKKERRPTNVKILTCSFTMKTIPYSSFDVYLALMNMLVSILVTWLMSWLKSCKTAHQLAENFTLVVEP